MSAARSLLAACACAALAHAARTGAGVHVATIENALPYNYTGFCHTEIRGYKSRNTMMVPEVLIPAFQEVAYLNIPDKCAEHGMELVGGVATACDADEAPALQLASMAAGAGAVARRGDLHATARCFVKLYCI